MAATAKIISLDHVRQSKAQQLTVTLSELVTTDRIPGLVTIQTDPQAIERIKIALSNAEYAMTRRRRENDLEFGRTNSFTTVLEPCEVFYSVCPNRHQLEIETIYSWSPPTPPPEDELDSVSLEEIHEPRSYEEDATVSVRQVAKVAAIVLVFLCTCLYSFTQGRNSYQKELARDILNGLLHSSDETRSQAPLIEVPAGLLAVIPRSNAKLDIGEGAYLSLASPMPRDIRGEFNSASPQRTPYFDRVSYVFDAPLYLGASVFGTKEPDIFGVGSYFGTSLPIYNFSAYTEMHWKPISAGQNSFAPSMFSIGVGSKFNYPISQHLSIDYSYTRDCIVVGHFYNFDFPSVLPAGYRIQQDMALDTSAESGECRNGRLAYSRKVSR